MDDPVSKRIVENIEQYHHVRLADTAYYLPRRRDPGVGTVVHILSRGAVNFFSDTEAAAEQDRPHAIPPTVIYHAGRRGWHLDVDTNKEVATARGWQRTGEADFEKVVAVSLAKIGIRRDKPLSEAVAERLGHVAEGLPWPVLSDGYARCLCGTYSMPLVTSYAQGFANAASGVPSVRVRQWLEENDKAYHDEFRTYVSGHNMVIEHGIVVTEEDAVMLRMLMNVDFNGTAANEWRQTALEMLSPGARVSGPAFEEWLTKVARANIHVNGKLGDVDVLFSADPHMLSDAELAVRVVYSHIAVMSKKTGAFATFVSKFGDFVLGK